MKITTLYEITLIICLFLLSGNAISQTSQKEIFIIGTMHEVPKIAKNSYRPLLKIALKYKPDAVYVEYIRPEDSVSLSNYSRNFLKRSDSLKLKLKPDYQRFEKLLKENLTTFTPEDFKYMANCFLIKRDQANYSYYKYLSKYGIKGSPKPLRNENGDLTAKLAIARNMKYLFAMDDQRVNKEYAAAWRKCAQEGNTNGDNKINQKLNKKDDNSNIIPTIFGRLGKHTNQKKVLELAHQLNSFSYVLNQTSGCSLGKKYWDERNLNMARNIADQVIANTAAKNVVIVGSGHVIGLTAALQKNYPDLVVRLISDGVK